MDIQYVPVLGRAVKQSWKTLLALAAVGLIPLVGWLYVLGFAIEWANLLAWDNTATPTLSTFKVGTVFKTGFRSFFVSLTWAIIFAIAVFIIHVIMALPLLNLLFPLVMLAICVAGLFVDAFVAVMEVIATIYRRYGAGLYPQAQVERIKKYPGAFAKLTFVGLGIHIIGAIIIFSVSFGLIMQVINIVMYIARASATSISATSHSVMVTSSPYTTSYVNSVSPQLPGFLLGNLISALFGFSVFASAISSITNIFMALCTGTYLSAFKPNTWGPYKPQSSAPATGTEAPVTTPAEKTAAEATAAPTTDVVPPSYPAADTPVTEARNSAYVADFDAAGGAVIPPVEQHTHEGHEGADTDAGAGTGAAGSAAAEADASAKPTDKPANPLERDMRL